MNVDLNEAQLVALVDIIEKYGAKKFLAEFRPDSDRSTKVKWLRRLKMQSEHKDSKERKASIRQDTFQNLERVLTSSEGELLRILGIEEAFLPTSREGLHKRSFRRLTILAREFGFQSELSHLGEREVQSFPEELRLAIASLYSLSQSAWISNVDIRPRDTQRIYVTQANDTHRNLSQGQNILLRVLTDLKMGEILVNKSDDFAVTTGPDNALFLQQLCVFPFTMSRTRRPYFGVIPYARQRMIGLVMHESHPAFQWMSNQMNPFPLKSTPIKRSGPGKKSIEILVTHEIEASSWLPQIIATTDESQGKVFSVSGDVQQTILFEALHQQAKERYSQSVEAINRLETIQRRVDLPSGGGPSLSMLDWKERLKSRSIFLFDPWAAEHFQPSEEYKYVVFPHNVDIKVGVGFSVNLLPTLLINDRWKKILEAAKAVYTTPAMKKGLDSIGIELLND